MTAVYSSAFLLHLAHVFPLMISHQMIHNVIYLVVFVLTIQTLCFNSSFKSISQLNKSPEYKEKEVCKVSFSRCDRVLRCRQTCEDLKRKGYSVEENI